MPTNKKQYTNQRAALAELDPATFRAPPLGAAVELATLDLAAAESSSTTASTCLFFHSPFGRAITNSVLISTRYTYQPAPIGDVGTR